MTAAADFQLRLVNRISSPAAQATKSLTDVKKGFIDLDASGTKAMRALGRSVELQAANAVRAEKAKQREVSATARRNIQDFRAVERLRSRVDRDQAQAARAAERAAQQRARAEVRAANDIIKARQREEREVTKAAKAQAREQVRAAKEAQRQSEQGSRTSAITGFAVGGIAVGATALAAVATAAVAAGVAVGVLATKFTLAAIEAGDFATKSRLALGRVGGGAKEGERAFEAVRRAATELGLDVRDTQAKVLDLTGAGLDLNLSIDVVRTGASLDATGGSGEGFVKALETIQDQGEFTSRSLRSLQRAGIAQTTMFAELSKATGKSREELEKMIAAGELKPDVAIGAALRAAMKETGETRPGETAAEQATKTFDGMRRTIGAKWNDMLISVGDRLNTVLGPAFSRVTDAILRGFDNPRLRAAGEGLLARFEKFGAWVDQHMPEIERGIVKAFDAVGGAIEGVNKTIDFLVKNKEAVKGVLFGMAFVAGSAALAVAAVAIGLAAVIGLAALVPAGAFMLFQAIAENGQSIKEEIRSWVVEVTDFIETMNGSKFALHALGRQSGAEKLRERFARQNERERFELAENAKIAKAAQSSPAAGAGATTRAQVNRVLDGLRAGGLVANDNAGLDPGAASAVAPLAASGALIPAQQRFGKEQPTKNITIAAGAVQITQNVTTDDPQKLADEGADASERSFMGMLERVAGGG